MGRRSSGLTALVGFAAGVLVGVFFASGKSRRVGEHIAQSAQEGSEWLNDHVGVARQRVMEAGDEAVEKLREGVRELVQNVLPDIADDPEAWEDVFVQTVRDLQHPRK